MHTVSGIKAVHGSGASCYPQLDSCTLTAMSTTNVGEVNMTAEEETIGGAMGGQMTAGEETVIKATVAGGQVAAEEETVIEATI